MSTSTPFGAPGLSPAWSSSDKDTVTTALGTSRLWVTIGHGILNEVYWPSTGEPRLRDLSFYLVGADRWIDLKREHGYSLSQPSPEIPLPTIRHEGDGYALELEILPDPQRDAVLIRYKVEGPWTLVVIAAPHLNGEGTSSRGWVDGALFATGPNDTAALCLASQDGFEHASVGYVGASDGWQDLNAHGRLTYDFAEAHDGNLALTGALEAPEGVLALAFSKSASGARTLALSALAEGPDPIREAVTAEWSAWGCDLEGAFADIGTGAPEAQAERIATMARQSAAVLRTHEDRGYPGALVASLSVPWGASTDTLGGYHLVWPRDATLAAFGFLACEQTADAARILSHLIATQCDDGHWSQNFYPSGKPFWTGRQLDEAGFPVLLAAKLRELGVRDRIGTEAMVRRAVRYVARTGPGSEQDRWEENPGINPFTLAVAIAALVSAAPWLPEDEAQEAAALADDWCARIEDWCYVTSSRWTDETGVPGHYIRMRPADGSGTVGLKNRNGETIAATDLVAMEFSYLSRLGLRANDDPRILNTLKVVDHALATDTPSGTVYHRYNEDGYGEKADGSPFDGAGIGRGWPFLVGERGHLALGLCEDALPYLATMMECASAGGLMPEQVWDSAPIPERGLQPGRPSGSAMPLLWTHSEFLKLARARQTGVPIERLTAVADRYAKPPAPAVSRWRDGATVAEADASLPLIIEDAAPFVLHFGWDGWTDTDERDATESALGLWQVRFEPGALAKRSSLEFTRRRDAQWEGVDHTLSLKPAS